MQIIIRIPIMQIVLPGMGWYKTLSESFILYSLFLGFTAALFETFGRYITLNFLLKKRLSYTTGIIHGIGHGGIEAILLVGLNNLIFVVFAILLNSGNPTPLSSIIPLSQQGMLQTSLMGDASLILMAGFERAVTMIFHISLSLLITIGIVKKRQLLYTGIVMILHTAVDSLAAFMSLNGVNVWIIEGMVLIFGAIALIIIIKTRGSIQLHRDKDEAILAVSEGY
jgi:uncharacterized membrane protein YhfC